MTKQDFNEFEIELKEAGHKTRFLEQNWFVIDF
jgi:translation elongation factor P/translation initiation factor 5A